jgi:hypothetical protein
MTGHVTSRYQGLNSSEVGAKIENLGTRLRQDLTSPTYEERGGTSVGVDNVHGHFIAG